MEYKRIVLTDEDKDSLMVDAAYLLNVSFLVRQNGIFYVEDEIEGLEDEFFKMAYKLMISSAKPKDVKQIIYNLIHSSYTSDAHYVKMCMQADALFMMGIHPIYFINIALFSYFGLEYKMEYRSKLKILLPNLDEALFQNDNFIGM